MELTILGTEFITIYLMIKQKIATLKINVYTNLPEFIIALNCKNIGNIFFITKIIMKIKKFFTENKKISNKKVTKSKLQNEKFILFLSFIFITSCQKKTYIKG